MSIILKTVSIGLQILGVLFLVVVIYLVFAMLTFGKHGRGNVDFVFGKAGLDHSQNFEVISHSHSGFSLNGDYEERICLEISTFEPSALTKNYWKQGILEDGLSNGILEQVSGFASATTCLEGAKPVVDPEVWYFVHRAEIIGGDRVHGSEVTFYDPRSQRLLYYAYQF